MLRVLSTRRSRRRGYEQLDEEEASSSALVPELSRTTSLPAAEIMSSPKKIITPAKQAKKVSKLHPFFGLLDKKREKKAAATPEFARYLEYVREGGVWDTATNKPVMHYT